MDDYLDCIMEGSHSFIILDIYVGSFLNQIARACLVSPIDSAIEINPVI